MLAGMRPGIGFLSHADLEKTNAINRACVVLLCAHLEGYLEDLAVDIVDCLVRNGSRSTDVPLPLRMLHFESHASRLLAQQGQILQTNDTSEVEAFFRDQASLWGGPWQPPTGVLDATLATAKMSNPTSAEIRRFLAKLGITDAFRPIMGSSHIASPQALRDRIDDLVRKRHAVAHGAANTADSLPTSEDVDRYFGAVLRFAIRVEAEILRLLEPVCAPDPVW